VIGELVRTEPDTCELLEPLETFGLWDPSLECEISQFKTEDGDIRLRDVQGKLNLNLSHDQELLMELYSRWVLEDVGIVVEETREKWQTGNDWMTVVRHRYSKARKRGNDMDAYRVSRKMRDIRDAILPYCQTEHHLKTTRAVYITLTVDPRRTDGDLELAWRLMGRMFNDFKSRLSQKLGTVLAYVDEDGEFATKTQPCKVHAVRSWEAHESGWPHAHAVLCFEDFSFGMFQDGKGRWRVKEKGVFEDAWPHGFVDVVALTPGTVERELENVLWYVSKNLSSMDYRLVHSWPRKRRLTQSVLWYLRSRSFSISRCLATPDLIKRISITQNDLEGKSFSVEIVSYRFLGMIERRRTELHRDDWVKDYPEPPDWLDLVWKPRSRGDGSVYSTWGD
jgi:hypothetical protein